MSRMHALVKSARADWGEVPAELDSAWDWMESQGFGGGSGADAFLTAYPGSRQLGPVFSADRVLTGWFEPGTEGYAHLLPIAEAAGDGSLLLIWRESDEQRFVVLGSEGGGYLVAESALELLQLLAIGYSELTPHVLGETPDEPKAVSKFRKWVQKTYQVKVPSVWRSVGDDRFSAWLQRQLESATPFAETPLVASPGFVVSEELHALLTMLGMADGPEAAQAIGKVIGRNVGKSLFASSVELNEAGLAVDVEVGVISTIWIKSPRFERFSSLIDGVTRDMSLLEVRQILGEPERESPASTHASGDGFLRYVISGKHVHLEFRDNSLTRVTLMVEAP